MNNENIVQEDTTQEDKLTTFEYNHKYYRENKDKYYRKHYCKCCDKDMLRAHKTRHERSRYHLLALKVVDLSDSK